MLKQIESLHKCFNGLWLALAEKKYFTKPLMKILSILVLITNGKPSDKKILKHVSTILEDTAFGQKKSLFWPIFANFWCPVVTLVTFSSNLSNFERNPKKPNKSNKNPTNFKKFQ